MLALLVVGVAAFIFASGVFVGSILEQMQWRMGLRRTELHVAVRQYLDVDAVVAGKRPTMEEWKMYSAAHHRLAAIVGWERPSPTSSGVHVRGSAIAREERRVC
ncbi:hypothetical protein WMF30_10970 [Sorangium sp. So ce134]